MIDAVSGAIYVLGGEGDIVTFFNDVWASADGGARAGLGQGGCRQVLEWGTPGGTQGVLEGYGGQAGVLRGTQGYSGVLRGYLRGTR